MGQCLEAYHLKIGLYDNSFHGSSLVTKSHSRVTPEARIAMTVLVSVCCAVVMLGWAGCSSIAVADMCGSPCWTGHCSITSVICGDVNFRTGLLKLVLLLHWTGVSDFRCKHPACLNTLHYQRSGVSGCK